jgi:hypothetical protein
MLKAANAAESNAQALYRMSGHPSRGEPILVQNWRS